LWPPYVQEAGRIVRAEDGVTAACDAIEARLESSQEIVVIGVRPDPEPDDLLTASDSQGAVMEADPHRVDRL
jgi:hypothetical protein